MFIGQNEGNITLYVRTQLEHENCGYKQGHLSQAPNLLIDVFGRCEEWELTP